MVLVVYLFDIGSSRNESSRIVVLFIFLFLLWPVESALVFLRFTDAALLRR